MDSAALQALLQWIDQHQTWAGVAVFIISLSESLALVGLFVPGVLMMFAIGALIATGSLPFWGTLAWAVAGAVVGDGISFWLGHHFRDRLSKMWPFRRYPAIMERGAAFFALHGGKSVLFGRFVGPVRPVIPVIAGMMGMTVPRFIVINIASAVAWAPAYLLPGVVFGASLNLAAEVASRLAALALGLLLGVWSIVWFTRRIYIHLQPRAAAWTQRVLDWGRAHPRYGHIVTAVVDPQEPETRGLTILALLLLLLGWALVLPARWINTAPPWVTLDAALYKFLQNLRTPWVDQLQINISALGETSVLAAVGLMVGTWLAWRRHWLALGHWCAAYAFGIVLTYASHVSASAGIIPLPSSGGTPHLTLAPVVYGFLAVLITHDLRGPRRWLPYALAGLVITAIAVAQLYLGGHHLSQAAAGIALGCTWVVILGAAYRSHLSVAPSPKALALLSLATLALSLSWYNTRYIEQDMARYTPPHVVQSTASTDWWDHDWRALPAYRIDLRGAQEQPLTLQWAGPISTLQTRLIAAGWHTPAPARGAKLLQWLQPNPPLDQLPVLPQVHNGHHEALLLIHATGDPARELVLRLWPSDWVLTGNDTSVWVGYAAYLRPLQPLPLFTAPVTAHDFDEPRHLFSAMLAGLEWRAVQREAAKPRHATFLWDGTVLLIRPPGQEDSR